MLDIYVSGENKIFVTAGLAAVMQGLGYSCEVFKPVDIQDTLSFVRFVDPFIKTGCSYNLKNLYTPVISAALEGFSIDKNKIISDFQKIKKECLIVDGCAGLNTPMGKNFIEKDIIKLLDLPVLLTISAKNCNISKVLLEINSADDLKRRGVIITDYCQNIDNPDIKFLPALIEEYTNTKVFGVLPQFSKNYNPNNLVSEIMNGIDIEAVFDVTIAKLNS